MTTAEKIALAWEDGKITMSQAVKFADECGLCWHREIHNTMHAPDTYTFVDSSVLSVDWIKSIIYC